VVNEAASASHIGGPLMWKNFDYSWVRRLMNTTRDGGTASKTLRVVIRLNFQIVLHLYEVLAAPKISNTVICKFCVPG
jgi:hypothetical protein